MVGDLDAALRWAEAEAAAPRCVLSASRRARTSARCGSRGVPAPRAARRARRLAAVEIVALSGVYDIAAHFAHENTRLVHWLSPMWLAMAGRRGEAAADDDSFARLVLERAGGAAAPPSAAPASRPKASTGPSRARGARRLRKNRRVHRAALANWCAASPTRLLRLLRLCAPTALGAAWPPTAALHAADGTVPARSAREFVDALSKAGADVRTLEYAKGGHGEIPLALASESPITEVEPSELGELCRRLWRRRRRDL